MATAPVFGESIFEINDAMNRLDAAFDQVEGEDLERVIREYFETTGRLQDKADNYAALIERYEAALVSNQTLADRYASVAQNLKSRINWMKRTLLFVLEQQQIKKISTERFVISVAGNGGKKPVEIDPTFEANPNALPVQFRKITVSLDKDAIRDALEAGEEITAANPYNPEQIITVATIKERGNHLRIKEQANV